MGASESKAPAGAAAVAAAMSGDSQAFSLAVQNGIDSTDAQGNTALIAAAFAGNSALALQLLGSKADVSKQNNTGCDATWVAAAYGKSDVLQAMLAAGGSAHSCNKQRLQGDSALLSAVFKGHESTVDILLRAGASIAHKNKNGDTAISVGVSSAFAGLPALLDRIGADDSQLLLQPNAKNVSPLHAACSLSSPLASLVVPQLVFLVLSHFPHILSACTSCSCCLSALSQTDSNGATPLHVAAHCGNATAIDLLIACAKEHNMTQLVAATEGGGKSALWLAAAAGHADAVEALLKYLFHLTLNQANASIDVADALQRLSTTNNGQAAEKNGHATCAALLRQ